jgi:hypothetical protein
MTSNSNEYLCTLLKRNKSYDHFSLLTTKKNKTNSFILNTKETLHSISKLRYKLKKTNYNHNEKEIHSKKMSYLDISKPNILTSKSNKNSKSFSYLPIKKSQPLNQLSDKINTKNKSYLSNKNSQLYLYKINKDSSINYSVSTNLERSFSNKSINSSRRILKENFDNYKCQEFNLIKFFNNENVLDSQFLYEKIFDEKTNIYKKLINSISLLEKQKNLLEIEIEKYEKSSSENSNESVKIDFIKRRLESQSKFNHQEIIKIREESIKVRYL